MNLEQFEMKDTFKLGYLKEGVVEINKDNRVELLEAVNTTTIRKFIGKNNCVFESVLNKHDENYDRLLEQTLKNITKAGLKKPKRN